MLRFNQKPTKIFTEVLDRVFDGVIFELGEDIDYGEDNFIDVYYDKDIKRMFGGVKIILNEIKKLQVAHKCAEVYMPTDYHFLLLDRMLHVFCDCYNDMVQDSIDNPKNDFSFKFNEKSIIRLDFNMISEIFFWDDDYDFDPKIVERLRKRDFLTDITKEGLRASARELIDTSDVRLEKFSDTWEEKDKIEEDDDFDWFECKRDG